MGQERESDGRKTTYDKFNRIVTAAKTHRLTKRSVAIVSAGLNLGVSVWKRVEPVTEFAGTVQTLALLGIAIYFGFFYVPSLTTPAAVLKMAPADNLVLPKWGQLYTDGKPNYYYGTAEPAYLRLPEELVRHAVDVRQGNGHTAFIARQAGLYLISASIAVPASKPLDYVEIAVVRNESFAGRSVLATLERAGPLGWSARVSGFTYLCLQASDRIDFAVSGRIHKDRPNHQIALSVSGAIGSMSQASGEQQLTWAEQAGHWVGDFINNLVRWYRRQPPASKDACRSAPLEAAIGR